MIRLAGIDASFLYSETPSAPMHTLKIAVLDAERIPGEDIFARLKVEMGRRLHLLPGFRRRALPVPLGLGHPVWVDDPDFSLDRHLRRGAIAAPGTQLEMDAAIAAIAARPLRRDRPLWEIWMLEGMRCGALVVVAKLHHALADGGAAVRMLAGVMQPNLATPPASWAPPPLPRRRRLVLDALSCKPGRARRFLPLLRDTARKRLEQGFARPPELELELEIPKPFDAPRTLFNCALPRGRSFATTRLDLEDIKRVKRALGVTLNDVVLALAGTAAHSYLDALGDAPTRPLIAAVPVGTGAGDRPSTGNHLSNIITSLCTDVEDPVARVHAIHRTMEAAKLVHDQVGVGAMRAWAEYMPPTQTRRAMRLYSRLRLADWHRPPVNLIVSNVRGPASILQTDGAVLRDLYSVGPVLDGIGLNLTAWSYAGGLSVSALSHARLPKDLHDLTDRLHEALADLLRRVTTPTRHVRAGRRFRKRRPPAAAARDSS